MKEIICITGQVTSFHSKALAKRALQVAGHEVKNSVKNMKTLEVVLFILLVLYLVSGVSTPYALAPYTNNVFMWSCYYHF